MQVQVAKWGNSLGLRVPKEVAAKVGLSEGSRVEMSAEGSTITISVERPVYALRRTARGYDARDHARGVGLGGRRRS